MCVNSTATLVGEEISDGVPKRKGAEAKETLWRENYWWSLRNLIVVFIKIQYHRELSSDRYRLKAPVFTSNEDVEHYLSCGHLGLPSYNCSWHSQIRLNPMN